MLSLLLHFEVVCSLNCVDSSLEIHKDTLLTSNQVPVPPAVDGAINVALSSDEVADPSAKTTSPPAPGVSAPAAAAQQRLTAINAVAQVKRSGNDDIEMPEWQRFRSTCVNCGRSGHVLSTCMVIDEQGFVCGCPKHNTRDHDFDACPDLAAGDFANYLYLRRQNMPPIITKIDFRRGFEKTCMIRHDLARRF